MMTDPATHSWHFDKRVPIALIVTLFLQAAGLIIWGTRIDSRVGTLEEVSDARSPLVDRFLRLEADSASARSEVIGQRAEVSLRLNRIEDKLDRLIEGRGRETGP